MKVPEDDDAGKVHERGPNNDDVRGDEGMVVLSYVLAGMLFYGGIGWWAARHFDQDWLLPVGMVLGLIASMYLVIKRYGKSDVTKISHGVEK